MLGGSVVQNSICSELIQRLAAFGPSLGRAVALAAEVDCLLSLAQCARDFRYSRPRLTQDNVLHIKQGAGTENEVQCSASSKSMIAKHAVVYICIAA